MPDITAISLPPMGGPKTLSVERYSKASPHMEGNCGVPSDRVPSDRYETNSYRGKPFITACCLSSNSGSIR